MTRKIKHDLYSFVAGKALESGQPFHLGCNCGGIITIMPPFEESSVICPSCESSIGILVIEDDPGYVIGSDINGNPILLPVQGSLEKDIALLSEDEKGVILKKFVQEREGIINGKSK